MWGWQGQHGYDVGMMGTTWVPRGQHGVETTETMETTAMETTWGPSGGYGDDGDDMGMTWGWWGWQGQCGDHGDNKITKNAITFEQIEIIEFRLKTWNPWTLPHTCRLQLMCRWGCPIPNGIFIQKVLRWPSKKNFLFLHWIPLDHI